MLNSLLWGREETNDRWNNRKDKLAKRRLENNERYMEKWIRRQMLNSLLGK
jgi:hypothetical protein